MKKILVCFDGTGNEPEDADPGDIEPSSTTGGLVEKNDLESHPDPAADDHSENFEEFAKRFFDALGSREVIVP